MAIHFKTIGQTYRGFRLVGIKEIKEIQCNLLELIHEPTGAHVMHIANDDPENLFCLSFQTLPESSNGVAHILEHTVLCGSEKFPVKDPFFCMTRRSLNTFMNAFTGSDFTCYPAASQVPKDFYNLLEVYIDAVFKPNLNALSFLQEGHRLEFEMSTDPTSALTHKGIVFNEMKGALASGNARLEEAMTQALFPQLPYGFNSGGDPKIIPHLTYQELCDFHKKYYHPGRCFFFFYGNMPLTEHLDFIEKYALHAIEKVEPLPPLPLQPRFAQPKRMTLEYPISSDEESLDKALISFGWLTCHILEQEETLALTVLELLLMDTDASPLKFALLKSGFCKQASIYMDVDISEVPIILTLRGCEAENADALETVLRETLKRVINEGISLEAFDRVIHQLEIARSEILGNHSPFGLSLFMRSVLLKQHGGNPENGLMIHSLFDRLRKKFLKDPTFFTGLIQKHFLDNPHFVRITMMPSHTLAAEELEEEIKNLKEIKDKLSSEESKQIVDQSIRLVEFQKKQEEEDPDILPKITLKDVPYASREYALTHEKQGHLDLFHHGCFTNSILYADIVFDLPEIPEEDLPFVRLFTTLLSQIGCAGREYTENLEYIQAHTGGIGASLAVNLNVNDYNQFSPSLYLRGKALYGEAHKLFPLLRETATSLDFTDKERLKEIILKQYVSLQNTLVQNALRYAINLAGSAFDLPSYLGNIWYGIEYYKKIKELSENIDSKLPKIIEKMQKLNDLLLNVENPHLVLSCSDVMYKELKDHDFYGLIDLPTRYSKPWVGNYSMPTVTSQGRVVAAPIAFTGHLFKTLCYTNPDTPALTVAASLFENVTLHALIREKGGAYGGGANCNTLAGSFYFYSYRDPNINTTLSAFKEAIQNVVKGEFEESDLEEAKLEVIQDMDAPVAPGSRGDLAYGRLREGKTVAVRQAFRDRLLAVTKKEVIQAVKKHVVSGYNQGVTIIFAGKELLEKENGILMAQNKPPLPIEAI